MKIQPFIHDLYAKKVFLIIARLTLTFDLLTLTLCQPNLFIDINHTSEFHSDRISRLCFIDESFFHITDNMTLTFDPVTLTLCQLNVLICINHMCQYHEGSAIRS